jgi:hypothetical protein
VRHFRSTITVLVILAVLGVFGLGVASAAVASGAASPVISSSGVWSPFAALDGVILAPTVTSFSPTSGPVGSVVTVNGSNFVDVSVVAFNGTPAGVNSLISATQLTATVPAGATTGPISVTNTGGTGTSTGSFSVIIVAAPTVTSFTPASGAIGSSVTVNGSGFDWATSVAFNGVSAAFVKVNDGQLTAIVPTGATSGPVTVSGPAGTGTSPSSFVVSWPAPTVTAVSPDHGPVGTTVTVTGTNFTGASVVTFGGTSAAFTVTDAAHISATVPNGAASGAVAVTTPGGTAASATSFTVNPAVSGFSPTSGPVGTVVTIGGTSLSGATAVTFGGAAAVSFTVASSTSINATVPPGAFTGVVAVTSPGGTATSAGVYTVTVVPAPTVSGFTPASGPVGTSVTITGTGLTGAAAVTFGAVAATDFTVDSATSIKAVVPAGAATGKVAVTTLGGTATSTGNFTVSSPTITSFTPTSGLSGASVTITGTGFTGATAVRFNGTDAAYIVNSSTQITATVPDGATTGPVAVNTPSGNVTSASSFTVASGAPVITSIDPTSVAAYGQTPIRLYVAGSGFEPGTAQVLWNDSVVLAAATPPVGPVPNPTAQLYVTLPTTVFATPTVGTIKVRNPATGFVSNSVQLTVVGPTISSITPATAGNTATAQTFELVGTNLQLAGGPSVVLRGITGTPTAGTTITATGVSLLLGSQTRISGTLNLATAGVGGTPAPAGSYDVSLVYTQDGAKTITLASAFTVTGAGLTGVEPATANNGMSAFVLTLKGTGLKALTNPIVTLKGPGTTGTTVVTGTGVSAANDGATMTATFNLTSPTVVQSGLYDVIITYAGTSKLTLAQALSVTNALPIITSLSPSTAWAGSVKPTVLMVNGIGFVPAPALLGATGSVASVGARIGTTTVVSGTQLTVPLVAADIAVPATVPITVLNPAPGGGTSAAFNLTVTAENTLPTSTITGYDLNWHRTPVTLTVTGIDSESGIQLLQSRIGSDSWTQLASSTLTVPAPPDHSGDGSKLVQVQATDWCNKLQPLPTQATVLIDTRGPTTTASCSSSVKKGKTLNLGYKASDALSQTCAVTLKIKNSGGSTVKTLSLGQQRSNTKGTYPFTCNLAKGKYRYYVYAVDLAGNKQTSAGSKTFQVK